MWALVGYELKGLWCKVCVFGKLGNEDCFTFFRYNP